MAASFLFFDLNVWKMPQLGRCSLIAKLYGAMGDRLAHAAESRELPNNSDQSFTIEDCGCRCMAKCKSSKRSPQVGCVIGFFVVMSGSLRHSNISAANNKKRAGNAPARSCVLVAYAACFRRFLRGGGAREREVRRTLPRDPGDLHQRWGQAH